MMIGPLDGLETSARRPVLSNSTQTCPTYELALIKVSFRDNSFIRQVGGYKILPLCSYQLSKRNPSLPLKVIPPYLSIVTNHQRFVLDDLSSFSNLFSVIIIVYTLKCPTNTSTVRTIRSQLLGMDIPFHSLIPITQTIRFVSSILSVV